ncbi:MAG: serine hydrolase domain-containing protein [Dongiaceae bacterium]
MKNGGLSKARLARLHETMAAYVTRGEMPGLVTLIGRRDELHVEAFGKRAADGHEPMQRDTIFRIASMSKPITAAAAMILVEECRLRLDEPVDALLPELGNRRVLKSLDAKLDDTVPANRPITLRDLLTFRFGIGAVMAPPGRYPIQAAMAEAGLAPGPTPSTRSPDEWMKDLGTLPLLHQPGEKWLYHTGSDVLGVLIARAAGERLEDFLRARIFEPLGMKDTGFHVPPEKLDRLASSYRLDPARGKLALYDGGTDSRWARPPAFPSGGGGLVSTADDYFAFYRMMLNKGRYGRERILSRPSVELMITDHLTAAQKAENGIFFGENRGWGFGLSVFTRRDDLSAVPGRFGWDGGRGTSAYADPQEDLIGILLTQRMMDSPEPPKVFCDFWTSAYQAIDD